MIFTFILKKLGYSLLVLLGVITVVFLLFNIGAGDPARMMLGQRGDQASIDAINKEIGRDLPLHQQYLKYLNDLSPLSFHNTEDADHYLYLDQSKYTFASLLTWGSGAIVLKYPYMRRSYQSKKKVTTILAESLPETLVLASAAIGIAIVLGILAGILSAIYKGSVFDRAALFVATIGMSGPSFFMGIIIAWVFGFILSEYTGLHMTGSLYAIDDFGQGEYLALQNLILPAATLGIRPLSVILQLTRNALLDVLSQDYIRTARAKGAKEVSVIFRHALKNALNPVVTAVSGWFAGLLAGAVFVEIIFAWKGIGWELFYALERYDLPVVMGAVLAIAAIFVVINILVDIIYTLLDPRLSLK